MNRDEFKKWHASLTAYRFGRASPQINDDHNQFLADFHEIYLGAVAISESRIPESSTTRAAKETAEYCSWIENFYPEPITHEFPSKSTEDYAFQSISNVDPSAIKYVHIDPQHIEARQLLAGKPLALYELLAETDRKWPKSLLAMELDTNKDTLHKLITRANAAISIARPRISEKGGVHIDLAQK